MTEAGNRTDVWRGNVLECVQRKLPFSPAPPRRGSAKLPRLRDAPRGLDRRERRFEQPRRNGSHDRTGSFQHIAFVAPWFGCRSPAESQNQASRKHAQHRNENLSVPVLQVQTQRPHGSGGVSTLDRLARRQVLRLPDPVRVLVARKASSTVPNNPEEADDQEAESEDSNGAPRVAERSAQGRRAPGV